MKRPLSGDPEYYLDQIRRFENSSQLVKYMCNVDAPNVWIGWLSPDPPDEDVPDLYTDIFNYEPICPFPYYPKGWQYGEDRALNRSSPIEVGDCSVILADTTLGFYDKLCTTYMVLAFVPGAIVMFYLVILSHNRGVTLNSRQREEITIFVPFSNQTVGITKFSHTNLSEHLCWLGVFISLLHVALCYDIDCWANRISMDLRFVLMSTCTACCLHVAVALVVAWITIVDGWQSKTRPAWVSKYYKVTLFFLYVVEVIMNFAMFAFGMSTNYEYLIHGGVEAIKNLFYLVIVATWGRLSWYYGREITKQLKSSNKKSPEEKKIRRYCFTCATLMMIAFFWKGLPIITRKFRYYTISYLLPSCKLGSVRIISCFFLLIQYSILYVQQPGRKKTTTRLVEAIASTLKSGITAGKSSGKSSKSKDSLGSSTGSASSASASASASASSAVSITSSVVSSSSSVHPIDESEFEK